MAAHARLAAAWQRLWSQIGALGSGNGIFDMLVNWYGEPHRVYHTLAHVVACLDVFDDGRPIAEHPEEIEFALWFHDLVYNPRSMDNEIRSASIAERTLRDANTPRETRRRVHDLILATRHRTMPLTLDEQLLVDVDLSILGAKPEAFDAYCRDIRREFDWIAEETYRVGRITLLQGFLKRDHIYATVLYRMRFERQAKDNLTREITALKNRPDAP